MVARLTEDARKTDAMRGWKSRSLSWIQDRLPSELAMILYRSLLWLEDTPNAVQRWKFCSLNLATHLGAM